MLIRAHALVLSAHDLSTLRLSSRLSLALALVWLPVWLSGLGFSSGFVVSQLALCFGRLKLAFVCPCAFFVSLCLRTWLVTGTWPLHSLARVPCQ